RSKARSTGSTRRRSAKRPRARRTTARSRRPSRATSRSRSTPSSLVRALRDPVSGERAEVAAHRPVSVRGPPDVVLGPAEIEVAVPGRPRRADVTVERHPGAARVDEVGSVRPRPPELLMAVAEDHGAVMDASEHPLVVLGRLWREALHVRK